MSAWVLFPAGHSPQTWLPPQPAPGVRAGGEEAGLDHPGKVVRQRPWGRIGETEWARHQRRRGETWEWAENGETDFRNQQGGNSGKSRERPRDRREIEAPDAAGEGEGQEEALHSGSLGTVRGQEEEGAGQEEKGEVPEVRAEVGVAVGRTWKKEKHPWQKASQDRGLQG